MKEIIGKKIGSTRVFLDNGDVVPVTVIEAGPCPVVAIRTVEKHGYNAYQVAFGETRQLRTKKERGAKRDSHTNKPLAGQYAVAKVEPRHHLREVRFDEGTLEVGGNLTVDVFKEGERIDVTGTSRGLGFEGVMKRHNFGGAQKTHGQSDRMRAPGSLGQSSFPSRVFKGMKMAGKMGNATVTVLNTEIVKIIPSENLMLIKGGIPGHRGSLVKVRLTNRARRGGRK